MSASRLLDRAIAVVLVAVALGALRTAFTSASGGLFEGAADTHTIAMAARAVLCAAAALLLAYGAWYRWSGRAAAAREAAAPLFGRAGRPARGSRRRWLDGLLVAVVVAVLVQHFVGLPSLPAPEIPPAAEDAVVDGPGEAAQQPPATDARGPGGQDGTVEEAPPVPPLPEVVKDAPADQDGATGEKAGEDAAAAEPVPPEPPAPPAPPAEEPAPAAPPAGETTPEGETAEPKVEPVVPPRTEAPVFVPPTQPVDEAGHTDSVVWLALAADGRSLLSASIDHKVKLWDIEDGRLTRTLGEHDDMVRVALFMPDGIHALTGGDEGDLVLRVLADGAITHVFSARQHGAANTVVVTDDGRMAVSGHRGGGVIVWDVEGRQVRHVLAGHAWPVVSVALSPDGKTAVTGSIEGVLKHWDLATGRQLRDWLGHERGTYGSAFTPDGRLVTGSGDMTIKLWDMHTGTEIRRFTGHSGTVYALELSADGKRIASVSLDGTARLWDIESGRELAQHGNRGPLYAVTFAGNDRVLIGTRPGAIRSWQPSTGGVKTLFAAAR